MNDDGELLRQFQETGSEPAFKRLVERYLGLVYSAALRRLCGDSHLAEDIAQAVFIDLARKAESLPLEIVLAGWLYRAACLRSAEKVRSEARRRVRERIAAEMNAIRTSGHNVWEEMVPILDEVMQHLNRTDRDALVLRFFQNASLEAVGKSLGITEDAAQKRVARALERLRTRFGRRGIGCTAAALSSALSAYAAPSAPAGLAATVSSAAFSGAAAHTGFSIIQTILIMSKLKTAIIGAIVIAGAAIPVTIQRQAQAKLRDRDTQLQQQSEHLAQLQAENTRLSNLIQSASGPPAPGQSSELLKLRGEVGVLKRELAAATAQQARPRQETRSRADIDLEAQEKQLSIAKMNYTKQSMLALINHAMENQGLFPSNLFSAHPELADEARRLNLAPDQFDLVYRGSMNELTNPGNTIVMREKEPHQTPNGSWKKVYGFADGHAEAHEAADGNFQPWEQEHMISPVGAAQPTQ